MKITHDHIDMVFETVLIIGGTALMVVFMHDNNWEAVVFEGLVVTCCLGLNRVFGAYRKTPPPQ